MPEIPSAVSLDLRGPIGDVGFDAAGAINAARTTVPKTSVDENHGVAGGKNEIRLAREGALMQPETEPGPMQIATHDKFGRRIPAPDFSHVLTTGLRGQLIHWRLGTRFFGRLMYGMSNRSQRFGERPIRGD